LVELGIPARRVLLVGGGARSEAVRRIAPTVFGCPVVVPEPSEFVADGAARQAAWALSGEVNPPQWSALTSLEYQADPVPSVRERYAHAREMVLDHP
jgi:xylulokinase